MRAEVPGFETQSTFTPNVLAFGIYFYRPAGRVSVLKLFAPWILRKPFGRISSSRTSCSIAAHPWFTCIRSEKVPNNSTKRPGRAVPFCSITGRVFDTYLMMVSETLASVSSGTRLPRPRWVPGVPYARDPGVPAPRADPGVPESLYRVR